KVRYKLDGGVNWRFAPRDVTTGQKRQRWSLNFRHNQIINETTHLNASGTFVSDKNFIKDFSHNLQDRLNQVLTTNATLSKRWPSTKNSITVNVSRTENLNNGDLEYTLPQISFSHTQSSLFSYDPKTNPRKKWYHDLFYNYGSNFVSRGSRRTIPGDSASTILRDVKTAWRHTAGLSLNSKIFKYIKYNQGISAEELWVPRYVDYRWVDSLNTAVADTVEGFRSRHTFNTSIGASTTIYGLFEIPFSPLRVIRHKMDPSISFSFSPDFSQPDFGYVQAFRDSLGRLRKYDRFAGNPYGGTSSSEARRMNISVANLFQGKLLRNGEEKKIDLFYLNFNTAYNFIADSLNWNSINSSLRARASSNFDFNLSTTHSFYEAGKRGTGNRNEFVWEDGFAMPRLLSVQFNARVHLKPPAKKDKEGEQVPVDTLDTTQEEYFEEALEDQSMRELRDFSLPWDLTTSFSYSINRNDINNIRRRLDANISAKIEITRNWRVQYTASVDLKSRQINYHSFNIYRDLHCWEMSFDWAPNPRGYSYFSLRIQVKSSALRDIKLTKTSAGRRVY
ncbi:MAG: putative LPS assembly protein LptD, partial [Calditrichia bacterium]